MSSAATAPAVAPACAPAPVGPPLPRIDAEQFARVFKALSDPTRLQILSIIEVAPSGEACVCDLTEAFDMTQPAISHHLKILVEAGVLNRNKRGSWVWYSLNPGQLEPVKHLMPKGRPRLCRR
ncbi:ArsR/SmtB family transcription factor [Micromonospora sp. NPDC051227]|uniref:ArsR/SmtB family transcription factor n=1 Tax=Micromonospora sp. NPDC051227 TaxID=3364285 RepID=UPI0019335D93|nr:helix-turn-helix transcriptional regulator [Micromonospora sp. STR1s_5]